MTKITYGKFSLAAATVVFSGSVASAATLGVDATAYTLGDNGRSLITLATPDDAAPTALNLSFGGKAIKLQSIAYRPKTTELYGYSNKTDTVYVIDTMTGDLTSVVTNKGATTADALGFDFNNQLDAARIVTKNDENVVFFPNNTPPTLEPKTSLFYVAGDVNEGANPTVIMNAYTNAVADASSTTQYVIDKKLDILATLGNNAGTLSTIGALTLDGAAFDVAGRGGFDILSFSEGDNTAFAMLKRKGDSFHSIYQLDLLSGALSFIESTPTMFGKLQGLAVAPMPGGANVSAVPLPAGFPLLAGAVLGFAALRRRGKRKVV